MARLKDLDKNKVYQANHWSKNEVIFHNCEKWQFTLLGGSFVPEDLSSTNKTRGDYEVVDKVIPPEFYKIPILDLKDIYG